jgi:ABC-type uncharacterized transport system ATPase subunit
MNDSVSLSSVAPVEEHAPVAISARGLVKRFGAVPAVNGIDLEVRRGTIFAILGPNGARQDYLDAHACDADVTGRGHGRRHGP